MKALLFVVNLIGAITFYFVCIMILKFLCREFKVNEFVQYFLYFGLGTLLYFPLKYILNRK
jgi:hypothetical protein